MRCVERARIQVEVLYIVVHNVRAIPILAMVPVHVDASVAMTRTQMMYVSFHARLVFIQPVLDASHVGRVNIRMAGLYQVVQIVQQANMLIKKGRLIVLIVHLDIHLVMERHHVLSCLLAVLVII